MSSNMSEMLMNSFVATAMIVIVFIIAQLVLTFSKRGILILTSKIMHIRRIGTILDYLLFVGTIHHELSHAIFAFIFGAKITKIELFKPVNGRLGCVAYYPRGNKIIKAMQDCMISIAPSITAFISCYLIIFKLIPSYTEMWQLIVSWYAVISIAFNSTLSKEDIRYALKGLPISSIIIVCVIYLIQLTVYI